MNNFSFDIVNENNLLEIITNSIESITNNVFVNIENSIDNNIINVESAIVSNINNIEILKYNDYDLVLTNTVYANLPDEIPISRIVGNLPVHRIENLDDYLNSYAFDCGTP